MVNCGSDQGRRIFETGGVAALHREFHKYENADLGHKAPFMEEH
jgi:hypothetical protein